MTYLSYQKMSALQNDLQNGLQTRMLLADLSNQPFDLKYKDQLQKIRRNMGSGTARAEALSNVIEAYSEKDKVLLHKRVLLADDLENFYVTQLQTQTALAWQNIERYALLAICLPVIFLFYMMIVIRRDIFSSLDRLSRRMMDFLVDRYSFQFSNPENSEIGRLQQTFNALAQRSINGMDELKTLDEAKSEFLNITSHELRTPMTSIKGSLGLLTSGVMGEINPQAMRLLQIAEVETDRLIRMTNDFLDLAKIEAQKLPLTREWISWKALSLKSLEGLLGLAHQAQVTLVCDPCDNLDVYADEDRLQQVLTNLVSNAIKFSPSRSEVHLRTRVDGETLFVEVEDQGRGIASQDQALIFQKFRQASNSENPLVKGTGLGLTIAKAFVEHHGGEIGVQSVPGQGSTFYFTLNEFRFTSTAQILEFKPADRESRARRAA
jgi:signal transduction histidine kinase